MSNLKQYLEEFLKQEGLRQKDFAALINVKPNTLSQWVNDKRQPDDESWVKISRTLKVSIDDLLVGKAEDHFSLDSFSIGENTVVYNRDGKTVTEHYTPEEMATIKTVLNTLADSKKKDI